MKFELEKDRWQRIARDWYVHVVAEYPGPGRSKLHHHLGLPSHEEEEEEGLRGVYHFVNR